MRIDDIANNVFNIVIGTLLGLVGTVLFLVGCTVLSIVLFKLLQG
jgi:hypothetical protein